MLATAERLDLSEAAASGSPEVTAIVGATIAIRRSELPARVLEGLRRDLSLPNPERVRRMRLGLYLGATPERIECVTESDGWIHLPRGAGAVLRQQLARAGLRPAFQDRRVDGEPLSPTRTIDLRLYQAAALTAISRATQGTVVMPCGGGKTVVGAAAISAIGRSALVIVHTSDLVDQWISVISERLGLEPGVFADGEGVLRPVTVATVQTLVRGTDSDWQDFAPRFGTVILDEAHHAPASTFQTVLSRLPARYRLGLTATPDREDGLGPLLGFTFGKRLFEIGYRDLVAQGFLEVPEVRPVFTDFAFEYGGPEDHQRCLAALVADEPRNALIADLVAGEAREGHSILVLSDRVEHCQRLAKRIAERGASASVLVGATPSDEREEILEGLRDGTIRVVVASTVADEGLDVPRLDRIVLAFPGRTRGRTTQRLGRLMRPHPGKGRPALFDIVDAQVPVLHRQFRDRRRLYRELLP